MVMIASLAAVGLAPGLGSGGRNTPPLPEEEASPEATPEALVFPEGPAPTIDGSKPHRATIETNQGEIEIQLATDAPAAVNSFAFLAGNGFYDGTVFFYVDRNLGALAGDPTCKVDSDRVCSGVGGSGYTLPLEQSSLAHEQWAVAAPFLSEGGQEVHGSQFRILFEADRRLDGKETVFGRVVKGQDILESLGSFLPCSVVESESCDANADLSSALVIKSITLEPA